MTRPVWQSLSLSPKRGNPLASAIRLILSVILLFGVPSAQAVNQVQTPYDPTDDILGFFGSRCQSTYGSVSAPALNQSDQLKTIVLRIMNDDACKGITDALNQVALTTSPLLNTTNADLTRSDLKAQVNGLQLALATE